MKLRIWGQHFWKVLGGLWTGLQCCTISGSVLVSSGCCTKVPQTVVETTETYGLIALEAGSPRLRCQQGLDASESAEEGAGLGLSPVFREVLGLC